MDTFRSVDLRRHLDVFCVEERSGRFFYFIAMVQPASNNHVQLKKELPDSKTRTLSLSI